jgi:ubiquinone/menaquinone biosynthesis C-methylase UbiE
MSSSVVSLFFRKGRAGTTTRAIAVAAGAALIVCFSAFGEPAPRVINLGRSAVPPPLTEYMGRTIAQPMSFHGGGASWLLRKLREQEEGTSNLLPQLGLKPGLTVCDLGSGNGYHSLMMAPLVAPAGRILAVDIQKEMLGQLRERAEAAGINNVQTILGDVHDPHLPAESCDLILMVDVYHEFSHPEQMLAAIRRSLKPDGRVALVEYRAEDPDVPIKPEHKMSKAQILKEWQPNGFQLAGEYDKLPWQHLMFFKRKP